MQASKIIPKMYCNQCAQERNLRTGDFAGYISKYYWELVKKGAGVVCDGCGKIRIDPEGNRVDASNSNEDDQVSQRGN